MIKPFFIIGLLAAGLGLLGCNSKATDTTLLTQTNSQKMQITEESLKQILEAFNRHDLDAIMEFFSEDCSFDFPRGPEFFGKRFKGKAQVREALAGRFKEFLMFIMVRTVIGFRPREIGEYPKWTLTGTTTLGVRVKVRGCDLWEFRNGKVTRKDSYWKIVESATK